MDWIYSLSFRPDGTILASGSYDSRVHLWEVAMDNLKTILTGHTSGVGNVLFSPDGKTLTGCSNKTVFSAMLRQMW
ncbi:hypothetical protein F4Y93_10045 [Candidatus Poribacteria bacterium]|nr:hypothetical protein [Candidatus Poribacteria bacterium]